MAKVKLLIKSTAKNKSKQARIWVRVYESNRFDLFADSRQFIEPDNWNEKGFIKDKMEILDREERNTELRNLKNRIENELSQAKKKQIPITKEYVDSVIDQFYNPEKYEAKEEKITLFSFIRDFIEKAPNRLMKNGKPVCYKQVREYERTFFFLKGYSEKRGKETDFEDVDLNFYEDFMKYLQSIPLATNTIGKKVQTLKIFLNDATDKGVNKNTVFRSSRFYTVSEESDSIYLTEKELDQLHDLDLSEIPRLENVRDNFLILCRTGVRYSDLEKINIENIQGTLIFLKQHKTGGKVVIPLHPWVKEILDKKEGYPPEMISVQKFNEYLKEVAKKAKLKAIVYKTMTRGGITKTQKLMKQDLISSHTGRRSFATNLYKAGFPSRSIMAVTGHKTEAAFLKYIKVTPEEHAVLLQEFWLKNGSHLKVV